MNFDQRGLTLSGANRDQAIAFDRVVDEYLDYRSTAYPNLKWLCADAPEFAMAHILKGYFLLSMGVRAVIPGVQASYQNILKFQDTLTALERIHLRALEAWIRDDTVTACGYWDDALMLQPLDILALKMQHFTLFWLGGSEHMRDTCSRVLPAWGEDIQGYANVLGMYAFGLEETGSYTDAEMYGRDAVERHPDDLWAIHAVVHVFEMQGRTKEGAAWLDRPLEQWQDRNPFKSHLWWHCALFALEKGEIDRVLDLYDSSIRPAESPFFLDLQNTASLLARLEFAGANVGDRWEELADAAEERQGDHTQIFTEPHCAMIFGRTGRSDQSNLHITSLNNFAAETGSSSAALIKPLVAPLCESIRDYYSNSYSAAIDTMRGLRYQYQPIGGSHAQRDIFGLLLIDAAIGNKDWDLANALLQERIPLHRNSYTTWLKYAEVCKSRDDGENSQRALAELRRITG